MTMPRSTISAANSGAVCSNAAFTASIIAPTGSARLSEIWRSLTTISFGTPFIRSRPRISIRRPSPSSGGQADPISFLMRSAVLSPTSRLCIRRMYEIMASSILSPPTRTERAYTTPPKEITATSVVPPPISTTIDPVGSLTGRPAPMAAAMGSSINSTRRAPAASAESWIARRSTAVDPEGTQITICGETKLRRLWTLRMKCLIISSATSKSAITPSRRGRIAVILPGVRPSICLASSPTARTRLCPSLMLIATTEGSFRTMPWPCT